MRRDEIPPCPKCRHPATAVELIGIGAGVGCTNPLCDYTIYGRTFGDALAQWRKEAGQ